VIKFSPPHGTTRCATMTCRTDGREYGGIKMASVGVNLKESFVVKYKECRILVLGAAYWYQHKSSCPCKLSAVEEFGGAMRARRRSCEKSLCTVQL
jgi:hypothetical protein